MTLGTLSVSKTIVALVSDTKSWPPRVQIILRVISKHGPKFAVNLPRLALAVIAGARHGGREILLDALGRAGGLALLRALDL